MKNIITLLLLFSFSLSSFAQNRDFIMMHGFGGDETSWQRYDTYFQGSRTSLGNVNRFKFNTGEGITGAATDADNVMTATGVTANPLNIAWGHSFGGLTIRQMEKMDIDAGRFGGYITAGTPHKGAPFAASYLNGDVQDFLGDACKKVVYDPINAATSLFGNTTPLTTAINELIGHLLCNEVLFNAIEEKFEDFTSPTSIQDLRPGNNTLKALNNFESDMPRVFLYGNEQSPVHWRWIQSATGGSKPNELPFGEVDDEGIKTVAQATENVLAVAAGVGAVATVVSAIYGGFGKAAKAANLTHKLNRGRKWLKNSESAWNDLIGSSGQAAFGTAMVNQYIGDTQVFQNLINSGIGLDDPILETIFFGNGLNTNPNQEPNGSYNPINDPDNYQYVEVPVWLPVNGQSDGLVPIYSAQLHPNECRLEIMNANHQELVNHPNATIRYEEVLNGAMTDCNSTLNAFFQTN